MQEARSFGWALAGAWLLAGHLGAQVHDYGMLTPREPGAYEKSGVRSFHLVKVNGIYEAEVFGDDERLLGRCEIERPETSIKITCDLTGQGKYELSWVYGQFDFKELATGQGFTLTVEPEPPGAPRILYRAPGQPSRRPPPPALHYQGSKTQPEAEALWSRTVSLMSQVAAETDLTLGNSVFGRRSQSEAREDHGEDSQDEVPAESLNLCPDGQELLCSPNFELVSLANAFGSSACCAQASASLDLECIAASGRRCCANSLCESFCIFELCTCNVLGWVWVCHDPCSP